MRCSLDRLYRRRDMSVRRGEQAGDLLGHRLVGGQSGELALPEVEITPGQFVEIGARIGGCVVVFGGHALTIADHDANAAFARANVALSHCGSSAKVTNPK